MQSGGAKQLIPSKHWRQIPAHHWQDPIRRNMQFSQYHFLLKCYFKMCASWNRWNRNTHKRAITDLNDLLEVQWVMNEPNPSVHIEINMRLLRESGQNTIFWFSIRQKSFRINLCNTKIGYCQWFKLKTLQRGSMVMNCEVTSFMLMSSDVLCIR